MRAARTLYAVLNLFCLCGGHHHPIFRVGDLRYGSAWPGWLAFGLVDVVCPRHCKVLLIWTMCLDAYIRI